MAGERRTTGRARLIDDVFGRTRGPEWARTRLLRTGEVAVIFQVSRRTISDWARSGKLSYVMTPGGQKRFPSSSVAKLLEAMGHTRHEGRNTAPRPRRHDEEER